MLSRIKIFAIIALAGAALFSSCKSENKEDLNKANDPSAEAKYQQAALDQAKKLYGESVVNVIRGHFMSDSTLLGTVALLEVSSDTLWGIEFAYLTGEGSSMQEAYKTKMLDGSFNESKSQIVKLPGYNHDLIYYNSQDYYLGSGGGDVYAYVIDFATKEIYSAHFFSYESKPTSLFISKNTSDENVKNFFVNEFKAVFPEVKVVNTDYNYYEELY